MKALENAVTAPQESKRRPDVAGWGNNVERKEEEKCAEKTYWGRDWKTREVEPREVMFTASEVSPSLRA